VFADLNSAETPATLAGQRVSGQLFSRQLVSWSAGQLFSRQLVSWSAGQLFSGSIGRLESGSVGERVGFSAFFFPIQLFSETS
jgi:hypothetical protein